MVVEVIRRAGGNAHVGEELFPLVCLAVAVGVAQNGEIGHVHHVECPVVPDHAEDRIELLGEDNGLFALAEEQDAVDRLGGGADLIHGVFADKERPVGGRRDLAGVLHGGDGGDQTNLEIIRYLGHVSACLLT